MSAPVTPQPRPSAGSHAGRRGAVTALICVGVVAGMVGLSFAAVPLYDLFCRATGFGGTTQRADKGADRQLDRTITVRFDANIANGLGWRFRPLDRQITVKVGQTAEVKFLAENITDKRLTGTAAFNVTPEQVGAYFTKIACFCFTEQTLAPGEKIEMPVVFFVDPAIVDDKAVDFVDTITLSYTFFPAAAKTQPVAGLSDAAKKL